MIWDFLNPIRYLWQALTAERTPRQIAWGIALGMAVGLVPKGNLTAWLFGVVILATRVNLGASMLSALVVTSLSSFVDPLTHGIGMRILSQERFRTMLDHWYNTPLIPWLSWNNTVVLGSTVLAIILLYPVQHLCHRAIEFASPYIWRYIPRSIRRRLLAATPSPSGAAAVDAKPREAKHAKRSHPPTLATTAIESAALVQATRDGIPNGVNHGRSEIDHRITPTGTETSPPQT